MRAINVITIKHNLVKDIETFPIYDEKSYNDVLNVAENYFKYKILKYGAPKNENAINSFVEEGIFENKNISVSLIWTTMKDK